MNRADRVFILEGIKIHLVENDPSHVTRNKFPLRRPSVHTERELRLNNWRVFYTVIRDSSNNTLVIINLIEEKRDSKLFIEGEEFEL